MKLRRRAVAGWLSILLLSSFPAPAHAQRLAPAGVQAARLAATVAEPGARRLSPSKHVWSGALIGGVTLGVIALVAAGTSTTECLGCPPVFLIAPAVLGTGAILGAGVGYVVYLLRRSAPAS